LVNSVLHTPVSSIIATRNGTAALTAMMRVFGAPSELRWDDRMEDQRTKVSGRRMREDQRVMVRV
jgi:hypothetical protein